MATCLDACAASGAVDGVVVNGATKTIDGFFETEKEERAYATLSVGGSPFVCVYRFDPSGLSDAWRAPSTRAVPLVAAGACRDRSSERAHGQIHVATAGGRSCGAMDFTMHGDEGKWRRSDSSADVLAGWFDPACPGAGTALSRCVLEATMPIRYVRHESAGRPEGILAGEATTALGALYTRFYASILRQPPAGKWWQDFLLEYDARLRGAPQTQSEVMQRLDAATQYFGDGISLEQGAKDMRVSFGDGCEHLRGIRKKEPLRSLRDFTLLGSGVESVVYKNPWADNQVIHRRKIQVVDLRNKIANLQEVHRELAWPVIKLQPESRPADLPVRCAVGPRYEVDSGAEERWRSALRKLSPAETKRVAKTAREMLRAAFAKDRSRWPMDATYALRRDADESVHLLLVDSLGVVLRKVKGVMSIVDAPRSRRESILQLCYAYSWLQGVAATEVDGLCLALANG